MLGKRIIWLQLVFLIPVLCLAQLTDDFSDGDFVTNPAWTGDQSKFIISAGRLKLQALASTGSATLVTSSQAVHAASWEFYVQFDFNPSSSNYATIYLMADQANLLAPLNGYFIKIGNTTREVSLYRQTGNAETEIIDGLDNRLNLSVVRAKIRVNRTAEGEWELLTDVGPSGIFTLEGNSLDVTHTSSSYFGIVCNYTSTRSDKFWFDDIVVLGSMVPDTTPPEVQSAIAVDPIHLVILFTENLREESAIKVENFILSNLVIPSFAHLQPDERTVELTLPTPFVNGVTYQVRIMGIQDLEGNQLTEIVVNVRFFEPVPTRSKDIIFSELFPDPTPQIGIPLAEFIEIHNRSLDPFDLEGWSISDGNSMGLFPSQIILPGEYWIIAAASSSNLFLNLGKTIGLANFPTLNNAGDAITLKDANGKTIDSVNYTLEWYRDADKAEGGWTLELIDPGNPCGEQDNWAAAEDVQGGTPGRVNSILANKPDLTAPMLQRVLPDGPNKLILAFDEKLKPSALLVENITIRPSTGNYTPTFVDASLRIVQIILTQDLAPRLVYELEVRNIQDCSGNILESASFPFGLPEKADSLDIIVNEILFNPRFGGVDFVEFYNSSAKFISLKDLKVSEYTDEVSGAVALTDKPDRLIYPHDYFVLSEDPQVVKLQFPQSEERNFIKSPLPSLPDTEGSIAIINEMGEVIDKLSYSKEWHSEFLKADEGVSLERISIEAATQDRSNWTSTSSTVGFATPGFINSQQRPDERKDGEVNVIPEIFVPGNGVQDFVQIQYQFDQSGVVANVMVLNHFGKVIRTLSSNDILAPSGFFRWDGEQEDGRKAPIGYYMIWFEIFRSDGSVTTFRRRVIVAWR